MGTDLAPIDVARSAHYTGDCRELARRLPDACVQTCITSPPYWGLRDYGVAGQIGLEATPADYLQVLVDVFREIRRVLRDDGTLWVNLGDSYAQGGRGGIGDATTGGSRDNQNESRKALESRPSGRKVPDGFKPKDMLGMPWRLAFALQADGWYLRSDIIWSKPNTMPESTADRPTKAHEYLFLLAKSERYYYDADAIREPVTGGAHDRGHGVNPKAAQNAAGSRQNASWSAAVHKVSGYRAGDKERVKRGDRGRNPAHQSRQAMGVPWEDEDGLRNKRTVWTVQSAPYRGAHFATFPPKLIEPCVLAALARAPDGGCVSDRGGQRHSSEAWAPPRLPRSSDNQPWVAHGELYTFGSLVVAVLNLASGYSLILRVVAADAQLLRWRRT